MLYESICARELQLALDNQSAGFTLSQEHAHECFETMQLVISLLEQGNSAHVIAVIGLVVFTESNTEGTLVEDLQVGQVLTQQMLI